MIHAEHYEIWDHARMHLLTRGFGEALVDDRNSLSAATQLA
jgi:hypothetical protein